MTYTGRVTPGGPADTREVGCLSISKIAVDDETSNNCYLLRCTETGEQVLIDAAADAPRLIDAIGDGGLTTVITTHQHWDHHRALAEVVGATGARWVVAGALDAEAITEQTGVAVNRSVHDRDRVSVGTCDLEVIALAGHTPGSIALLFGGDTATPHLFTGDSLFPGGVGATFGDEVAFRTLIGEVDTKIFNRLPDATWFYPGHGDDGQLGNERPHLAEWRSRGW